MKKIRDAPWKFLNQMGEHMSVDSTDKWSKLGYVIVTAFLALWAFLWWPTLCKQRKSEWQEQLNRRTGFHSRSIFTAVFIVFICVSPIAAKTGLNAYHYLVPRGEIRLQVLDDQGKPISGLDVNILPENSQNQVGFGSVTDGNGSVICDDLRGGLYQIWVFRNKGADAIESMSGRVIAVDGLSEEKWTFTPKLINSKKFADVNFETGESDIDQYFYPTLNEVRDYFETNPGDLFIYGHCDEVGSDERNFKLGVKRALEAKKSLSLLGATSKRVFMFSYGKSKPLEPGFPLSNTKNRRVEFYLIIE